MSQPYYNRKMALCDWYNKSAISSQMALCDEENNKNGIVCLKFIGLKWLQAIKYEQGY